jgi:hypothetical protein
MSAVCYEVECLENVNKRCIFDGHTVYL